MKVPDVQKKEFGFEKKVIVPDVQNKIEFGFEREVKVPDVENKN